MTLKDMENMKKSDLLNLAKKLKVSGFSRLTKSELIDSIKDMVKTGGESLKTKALEFIDSITTPVVKTRKKTGETKAVKAAATKEPRAGKPASALSSIPATEVAAEVPRDKAPSATLAKKKPRSTPSLKVISLTGMDLSDEDSLPPDSELSDEALAKNRVESFRYEGDALHRNGMTITPEELREIDKDLPELPMGYGDGFIHLMPRDPRWLLCYWDISEETRAAKGKYDGGTLYLKLHDITHIDFSGNNAWSTHRFRLNELARFWYIPVPSEGRRFMAELGYAMPDGSWSPIGTSDGVVPPPGSQSPWVHDVFITLPLHESLSLTTDGISSNWLGSQIPLHGDSQVHTHPYQTSPSIPLMGTPTEPEPWFGLEGAMTSPGGNRVSSFVSLKDDRGHVERFPLTVDGNLRVFGATKPQASLTIDGQETPVNADGTFSLTLPLPQTDVSHKVTAMGEKGEKYSITITIERNVRR
ncbi:DUF4912 domain-containing protein [Myxococcota bacterium]|nr:DUF4912 domain-containing protein [Myxococcota bacterium]MBU1534015.1 DUF4912 domain-containing protein [Myxococcota bacterium]